MVSLMRDQPKTIVEHLGELRHRLIYILLAVAATSAVAYLFNDEILDFIMKTGRIENLVFIKPMEAFFVIVKMSILIGVVAAMPFILYQVWKYVGVALKKNERKYLIYFGPVSYLLFMSGAALAFLGVMPLAVKFLLSFSKESVQPLITLDAYVNFLNALVIAFGLVFQLPLVILLLSLLGIVTPEMLKKSRKYAIVGIFVFAAVITPTTDAVSMMMLAGPVMALYEIGVLISKAVWRKKARADLEPEEEEPEPELEEV
jgi:sec-independent protein translocase protein TatC